MSKFVFGSVLEASFTSEGVTIFKLSGTLDGSEISGLSHIYDPRSKTPINLECRRWLEDNTPASYVEPDYITEAKARIKRDSLLEETDWWAVADRTMTTEQTNYRQALRDITQDENWPNMTWPVKPEV